MGLSKLRSLVRLSVALIPLLAGVRADGAIVNISEDVFDESGELGPSELLGQYQTFADLDNELFVFYQFSNDEGGFVRMRQTGLDSAEAAVEPQDLGFLDLNSGFRLYGSGDTGSNAWTLQNISDPDGGVLESITLDLRGELTSWFDRSLPEPGTANSGPGLDFDLTGVSPDGVIKVEYGVAHAGPFADVEFPFFEVNPEDLVGDAFKVLTIDLTGLTDGGLAIGQSVSFYQDTDPALIPEPGSLVLMGLASLALARHRRPT